MKIEPIETERLRLRGFTPADAMFAIGIWNSPDTGEYLIDEPMEAIDPAYLKEIEVLGEHPDCCYLIAEDKATGERVGTCSFIPEDGVYDIAYCVDKPQWRKGYATEMACGMLRQGPRREEAHHPHLQGQRRLHRRGQEAGVPRGVGAALPEEGL